MRFLLCFTVLALAVNTVLGATLPSSGTTNGLKMYNASTVTGCIASNGGCTITDYYYSTSQNAAVYAGAYSYIYQVNFVGLIVVGTLDICSDPSLNTAGGSVRLLLNSQLIATNVNIGNCANVVTTGSPGQNTVQLVITNLFVSGVLNSNAYKVVSTTSTTISGATFNVGTLYATGTAAFTGGAINMAVGFQNGAVTTVSGTTVTAGQIWLAQSGNTPIYSMSCTNGGALQSGGQFTISSPQSINNCQLHAGSSSSPQTLEIIPAPASRKRDGSTEGTTFNGGSSDANALVQTAEYTSAALFRKRSSKRTAAYANWVSISNAHTMTIHGSITQQDSSTAVFNPTCNSVLSCVFAKNQTTIKNECPGCVYNSTCGNSGTGSYQVSSPSTGVTSGSSSGKPKRGDDE